MTDVIEIKLSKKKLIGLAADPVKSAAAIHLVYLTDSGPGITRYSKGKEFEYSKNGIAVTDEDIKRIRSLVIPPAWQQVWISPIENSHLQATGIDTKNRKQYRYHPLWNALRNQTKFYHLLEFGKALPAMRERLQQDLRKPGLPVEKVLAAIVSIMQSTCIRVGNSVYEKLYGSFGLTTLRNKHVTISGSEMRFAFKGKKGVHHNISLKSKKLAKIVKQCREIPGHELFQFYTEAGERHSIDSGMVNNYIREISGGNFTAKDLRTWAGSLHAIEAFRELGTSDNASETKRNIISALDTVASQLGNTRTVCRKYYVHPVVIDHYTNGTFEKYLRHPDIQDHNSCDLSREESILIKMLEDGGSAIITV